MSESDHPSDADRKTPKESSAFDSYGNANIIGSQSPGVRRIEAISTHITRRDRILIFLGVFLIAYVYGLDGTIRYAYQPLAVASFGSHSLLATVTIVRSVISAAGQPTAAKIADVFGRVELIIISVFFYVIGTIVEATSTNVSGFSAGAVIYQIGYTAILLLVEVIVADITTTRARLVFSFIPALPFVINAWVSGDITSAVLGVTTWNWGVGMFAIIYPVCSLPLLASLWLVSRRAKKAGTLESYKSPYQMLGARRLASSLFWQLDVIGVILLLALLALILVPLTLAGGVIETWQTAHIIAPLVIGFLCIPVFIFWEIKSPHPMIPFNLIKNRAVWAALGVAVMFNFAWTLQSDYLYTVLQVAFDESIKSATRIQALYSFVGVVTGFFLGLVVYKVRHLKPFIMAGVSLFLVAFGLLIRYRGSPSSSSHSGIIGGQVLLGLAGGLFTYPTQASIQVATQHEHLAVVTGIFLGSYNVGSALGGSVSGAIWTQQLPKKLENNLAGFGNATLATAVYADPFTFTLSYPVGTPERTAVIDAYQSTQRLLCITGICLTVPLIVLAAFLRNPRLGDTQSLPEAEEGQGTSAASTRVEGTGPVTQDGRNGE